MHTCDPFTLRTSHGPSPPQWATAAKQAKCRQTFDSAWVPCIRTPGVGQFEQGGGRGLAGVGARGWTCGQLSLLEIAFPGLLRCGDFQNSLPPRRIAGFLDVRMSASDPRKPAAAPPRHPEMEECLKAKAKKKGYACHKVQPQIILVSQDPPTSHSEPDKPAPAASHGGLAGLLRPGSAGQGEQGRGSGLRTKKAFLELSTPEATELAKGRGRKSPSKETQGNAEELLYKNSWLSMWGWLL